MEELACRGGAPVRTKPWPHWPQIEADEIAAVENVLRSGRVNYWTGTKGREFEAAFADWVGRKHALALANGTVALELALWVLGIGPGDEVIVPARTFIATASAVAMRGATPVCADIDRESQNLTAATIEAARTPRTRAVIVAHLAGWPCRMDEIGRLAKEHDLRVVEDCAQALGAAYDGRAVGGFGDAAAFSFCQDKIMTTGGEGGMLVCDNDEVYELAWSLKDHGKGYGAVHRTEPHSGLEFRWLHERFGTNWRMTEMQAAIGNVALPKVERWVDDRTAHAAALEDRLARLEGIRITAPRPEEQHAYYKYYAFVRPERLAPGWDRSAVVEAISAEGVPCSTGSCPEVYLEAAFEGIGPENRLPVAKELGETSITFAVHPGLAESDIADACAAVEKVMRHATLG